MNELEKTVAEAKKNVKALDSLINNYLPFIKKQVGTLINLGLPYEDMLSLAMLVFTNCVGQYTEGRGGFLSFVKTSIKNRIIDESRKEQRHLSKTIPLQIEDEISFESQISLQTYNRELERQSLSDEIDSLSLALTPYNITFGELTKICPKQGRARQLCLRLAEAVVNDKAMKAELLKNKRLTQNRLANCLNISPKTIEKHRKYIITLIILLMGDYPNIRAYLPQLREVDK